MNDRSMWVIPANKWHAKVYNNWLVFGIFKAPVAGYQENLCHYWRVVVFWSWWTRLIVWLIERKTLEDPTNREHKLPPVIPICSLVIVGLFAWALYDTHPFMLATVLFVGIPLLTVVFLFLAYMAYEKYDDYKHGDATPNLLLEVVLAKKHKICPLITVEEELSDSN